MADTRSQGSAAILPASVLLGRVAGIPLGACTTATLFFVTLLLHERRMP